MAFGAKIIMSILVPEEHVSKKQLKGQVFEHVTDMCLETEFSLHTMRA